MTREDQVLLALEALCVLYLLFRIIPVLLAGAY